MVKRPDPDSRYTAQKAEKLLYQAALPYSLTSWITYFMLFCPNISLAQGPGEGFSMVRGYVGPIWLLAGES